MKLTELWLTELHRVCKLIEATLIGLTKPLLKSLTSSSLNSKAHWALPTGRSHYKITGLTEPMLKSLTSSSLNSDLQVH